MSTFSVKDAAFSGYVILFGRPITAAWWLLYSLVVILLTTWGTVLLAGPQLAALAEIQRGGAGDPTSVMAISSQLLPYQVFSFVFPLLTNVIALGAVNRAVLRPGEGRAGYLRLGGDELRLLVTSIVVGVIVLAACALAAVVVGVTAFATGVPAALSRGMAPSIPGILGLLVAVLLGLLLVVYVSIRFCLAPAQTVAERGVRIMGSWGLTRTDLWRIVATYVVAGAPLLVLAGLVSAWSLNLTASGPMEGNLAQMLQSLQPDLSTLDVAFRPSSLLAYALQAILATFAMAGLIAPGAVIYSALSAPSADLED